MKKRKKTNQYKLYAKKFPKISANLRGNKSTLSQDQTGLHRS